MKKKGIFNHFISDIVASMGHKDRLLITDLGFPIPAEAFKVDIALNAGTPGTREALIEVLKELQIEKAVLAEQMPEESPEAHRELKDTLAAEVDHEHYDIDYIDHWDMVDIAREAKGVIRTGSVIPYSNIVLVSGARGVFY